MKDEKKTRGQLIDELAEVRQRISELETLEIERKQIEAGLQQYVERQQALFELERAITSSLRLTDIYHDFARHAVRLLPYDRTSIILLEGDELTISYSGGEETPSGSTGTVLSKTTSSISRVIIQGQPVLRHNITSEADDHHDEPLVAGGIRSSLVVPLRVKSKIIGTWHIGSHQVGTYSPDDMELAQAMADQLARAIENARLYERAQHEIAERQRAEKAMRESEERFRRVIASISDHIYMAIYEGDVTRNARPSQYYISPNVEALVGYTPERFQADWNFWRSLIHHDDLPLATVKLDQFPEGGNTQIEYRLRRADGELIWVRDSRQLVIETADPGGAKRITVYGVVSDITERKHLEDQLYQAQKMEAIGRLAGGISHDFNNLLTVINGYSELILFRYIKDKGPLRQNVEQIKKAGDRAASLTRQLLAFSRKQVLQPEVLNLNSVVSNVDQMLRRLIGEDIELITALASELGQVKADPAQMDQVIMNLAVNARDAMPIGGKLTLETSNVTFDKQYTRQHVGVEPGDYVMLAISDTGHGMDAATKARIFEPFFTTKDKGRGTGLGLATVYGIINQSGGYIWVYSEPGHGTTFKIHLPRLKEALETADQDHVPAKARSGSETILLVEDEDLVRELAYEILVTEGYTVLEASHGAEALKISERYAHRIHLLLTDVVMPGGISGPELAERLAPLRRNMEVLYISGYTDNAIVQHSILTSTASFLEKPFTPSDLAHKVRDVLDQT